MLGLRSIAAKLFGTNNDRKVVKYRKPVEEINLLEAEFASLSDADLRAKTTAFRAEIANGKTIDDLLVPAFAVVREASKRALGMRHFDVQMIGGMVLNDGAIAEMKTGEGKTLVATLAVYLNALQSKGVHVVTVNDYLAKRDAHPRGTRRLLLTVGTPNPINWSRPISTSPATRRRFPRSPRSSSTTSLRCEPLARHPPSSTMRLPNSTTRTRISTTRPSGTCSPRRPTNQS